MEADYLNYKSKKQLAAEAARKAESELAEKNGTAAKSKKDDRHYRQYVDGVARNRIVQLDTLAEKLWCPRCDVALSLMNITNFEEAGLVVIYDVHCQFCDDVFRVPTSPHCLEKKLPTSKSSSRCSTPRPKSSNSARSSPSFNKSSIAQMKPSKLAASTSTSARNPMKTAVEALLLLKDSAPAVMPSTSVGHISKLAARVSISRMKLPSNPSRASTSGMQASSSAAIASTSRMEATTASLPRSVFAKAPSSAATATTLGPRVKAKKVPEKRFQKKYTNVKGRIIINLTLMAGQLWCEKCRVPLSLRHTINQLREGFAYTFRVHCQSCDGVYTAVSNDRPPPHHTYDINYSVLKGMASGKTEMMNQVFRLMSLPLLPNSVDRFTESVYEATIVA